MNHVMTPRATRGFSLIELMIAVAIIGILASIAYPNYTEYVRRGQRAEARSVLLDAAQFLQRFYSSNDTYSGATLPTHLTSSPAAGTQLYAIKLTDATRSGYTLTAAPQGSMASDACGTLILSSTGARSTSSGADASKCWR